MAATTQTPEPLPLVVLTGFLGSGKTTLLNRLLSDPSMHDTAVIINEFGDVGVDHLLVSMVADDVFLLASGCVCCNAGDDLRTTLASLLEKRRSNAALHFQRIVLETTGIAAPESLLELLLSDGILFGQIRVQAVVTVVDAVFGQQTLSRHVECASQIAMADRLIISKLDLIERNQLGALEDTLHGVNPFAPIYVPAPDDRVARYFLGCTDGVTRHENRAVRRAAPHPEYHSTGSAHLGRYDTFSFCWNEPIEWDHFKAWLECLLIARGDSILRMKGLLQIAESPVPLVVQGVQHALYAPQPIEHWPRGAPCSELVFVTRDFPRGSVLRGFSQYFPECNTHCMADRAQGDTFLRNNSSG